MALTDNRTQLQDCDATADVAGDSNADPQSRTTETGLLIEGGSAIAFQVTNAQEYITFDQDSAGATFNLDLSDSTIYINIKDNLNATFASLGALVVLADTADGVSTTVVGYTAGGSDATGLPYQRQYAGFKLDVSEPVATPGTDNVDYYLFSGTEADLDQTIIKQVGYGSLHLAKAVGTSANAWFDGIYYITNGSYAATINAGTAGTPETMVDVVIDDETAGMCMFANPKGSEFDFFAPTEWGNAATVADVYFTASDEQWYWFGDNGGGRPIGVANFPFRIVGNATDIIDIKWSNLVIVNIGQRAEFIVGDANVDVLELTNVSFTDVGDITFPVVGTGRFATSCTFNNCAQVDPSTTTFNGATFNGTTDPNGALLANKSLDSHIFNSDGTGHGIYITTPGTYTYTNNSFTGYGATTTTDAVIYNNSGGAVTINVNSGDTPTYRNGTAATTTIVSGAVTVKVTATTDDGTPIQNALVLLSASDGTGPFPYLETVTIVNSGTTATVTHTTHGMATNDYVQIRAASLAANNGVFQITNINANSYSYIMGSTPGASPTGTIKSTFVALSGLTDINGDISTSRVYSADQPVVGWTRKSSTSPFYKQGILTGTVLAASGYTSTGVMVSDE